MWLSPKERWEVGKIVFDAVVVLFAAGWAYYTFSIKDRPALAERRRAESSLAWKHRSADSIHAEFQPSLTNTGTSSFVVDSARLNVWTMAYAELDGPVRYMDLNRIIRDGKPIFCTTFTRRPESKDFIGSPFIQTYDEGATWNNNFDFTFKADKQRVALFLMQFYRKGDTAAFDWTYAWDPIECEDSCKGK